MNSETGDKKPVTVHLIIAFLERATENKCTVTEFNALSPNSEFCHRIPLKIAFFKAVGTAKARRETTYRSRSAVLSQATTMSSIPDPAIKAGVWPTTVTVARSMPGSMPDMKK